MSPQNAGRTQHSSISQGMFTQCAHEGLPALNASADHTQSRTSHFGNQHTTWAGDYANHNKSQTGLRHKGH